MAGSRPRPRDAPRQIIGLNCFYRREDVDLVPIFFPFRKIVLRVEKAGRRGDRPETKNDCPESKEVRSGVSGRQRKSVPGRKTIDPRSKNRPGSKEGRNEISGRRGEIAPGRGNIDPGLKTSPRVEGRTRWGIPPPRRNRPGPRNDRPGSRESSLRVGEVDLGRSKSFQDQGRPRLAPGRKSSRVDVRSPRVEKISPRVGRSTHVEVRTELGFRSPAKNRPGSKNIDPGSKQCRPGSKEGRNRVSGRQPNIVQSPNHIDPGSKNIAPGRRKDEMEFPAAAENRPGSKKHRPRVEGRNRRGESSLREGRRLKSSRPPCFYNGFHYSGGELSGASHWLAIC